MARVATSLPLEETRDGVLLAISQAELELVLSWGEVARGQSSGREILHDWEPDDDDLFAALGAAHRGDA